MSASCVRVEPAPPRPSAATPGTAPSIRRSASFVSSGGGVIAPPSSWAAVHDYSQRAFDVNDSRVSRYSVPMSGPHPEMMPAT
jgi:hypothetical protein